MSKTGIYENPLVPNKKLQQMFVAMTEMRMVDEHITSLQRKARPGKRLSSTRGQEACRVSTAIELTSGDLVSDAQAGVAMELLAGAKVNSLLRKIAGLTSKKKDGTSTERDTTERLLPWIEDAESRLWMALGAASSFKTLNRANIVVIYTHQDGIPNRVWKRALEQASKLSLPIIFVALPDETKGKKQSGRSGPLSIKARSYGLPGIPVDAEDAVALYRVAQESIGRVRAGGGPVLIECIAWHTEGKEKSRQSDPLTQMRKFLLGRKICSEAWLNGAGDKLRGRIKATKRKKLNSR